MGGGVRKEEPHHQQRRLRKCYKFTVTATVTRDCVGGQGSSPLIHLIIIIIVCRVGMHTRVSSFGLFFRTGNFGK